MSDSVLTVPPSGYADTALRAACAQLLRNAGGGTLLLEDGGYYLQTPITDWTHKVSLVGKGPLRTRIVGTFTGASDDPANALIRVTAGAAGYATTIAAAKPSYVGDDDVEVTAIGTIKVDDTIRVRGRNIGADEYDFSVASNPPAGYRQTSVEVRVVTAIAGNVITVDEPWANFHAPGVVVEVIGAEPSDLIFAGFSLEGTGTTWPAPIANQTIANGLTFAGCRDVYVEDIHVKGFSRAAVEFGDGTRGYSYRNVYIRDEVNCPWFVQAAHRGVIENVRMNPAATKRCHDFGFPLGGHFEDRPTDCRVEGLDLRRGVIAISAFGGQNIVIKRVTIADFDTAEAIARMTIEGSGYVLGGRCGVVWNGSSRVDFDGEYPEVDYEDIFMRDCHPGPEAFWFYDADRRGYARRLEFVNNGRPATDSDGKAVVGLNDSVSDFQDLRFRGLANCIDFDTQGLIGQHHIRGVRIEANAGAAKVSSRAFHFRNTHNHRVIIEDVRASNLVSAAVTFEAATFAGWTGVEFRDCYIEPGQSFVKAIPKKLPSANLAVGTQVEDDPGDTNAVRLTTATGQQYIVRTTGAAIGLVEAI